MWNYMNMELDPSQLPTKNELLDSIRKAGGTDRALADLRDEQMDTYKNELIWRYPISEGNSAGGFVTPVREGILWMPYDEMEREEGEILILDDASSALDYKTDARLRRAIREDLEETTLIVVAQRVSSVMSCRKILVLEEGRAVACGTHEELLATCDIYREISESQMGGAILE